MAYFTKRYHPPGTSPGALTEDEALKSQPPALQLMAYDPARLNEQHHVTMAECRASLGREGVTWIHVQGYAGPDLLRQLGDSFSLHALALEDVHNTGQRPKLDHYDGQLFAVMSLPAWHDEDELVIQQISIFCGKDFVVSFYRGEDDPFEPVRKRLRSSAGHIRERSADYLFYSLIDVIIDQGFPVLEQLGEWIEQVEEELLDQPARHVVNDIHLLKRDLLLLRRMLWPQREVINQLLRDEQWLIHADTKTYLRDCYDHTIQIMDLLETYRDMTSSMLDVYLSSSSNRLNEVMRVLTVIATLFIPPTFLVGVYGMNFHNTDSPWSMPELSWYYGYPLAWLIILLMIGCMLIYFKRKKWF